MYWQKLIRLFLAIAIAALGQYVLWAGDEMDLPVLSRIADAIFYMYYPATPILVGVLLLGLGAYLFATAVTSLYQGVHDVSVSDRLARLHFAARWDGLTIYATNEDGTMRLRMPRLALAAIGLGGGLYSGLVVNLAGGGYEEYYPILFFSALALIAGAVAWFDRANNVQIWGRPTLFDIVVVVAVTIAFIGVNLIDLNDWRYAIIGDEFSFLEVGQQIARGETFNLFSQIGVYDAHPVGSSAFQALFIKWFSPDYFGWRLSSVAAVAAALPAFYVLLRQLFNTRTAAVGITLFAASHVVLAYSHTGYIWTQHYFPTVAASALFFAGVKRGSAFLLLLSGVTAGLGFYTVFSARSTIVILAIFLLFALRRISLRSAWFIAFGFVLAFLPMLATEKWELISTMSDQSVLGRGEPGSGVLVNAVKSLVGFNFDDGHPQHHSSGSMLEPISAVLFVLGLGLSLRYVRDLRFRFLLIWYLVALTATGVASPYPFLAVQRIAYVIPVVVALGAVALDSAFGLVEQRLNRDRFAVPVRRLASASLTAILLILLLAAVGSNLYRFWHVTPNVEPPTANSLLMRAVESDTCNRSDRSSVVIGTEHPILIEAISSRNKAKAPVLLGYGDVTEAKAHPLAPCIIYLPRGEPPEEAEYALKRLFPDAARILRFEAGFHHAYPYAIVVVPK